jgi:hypothetical protein
VEAPRCKARQIESLLIDGQFRPFEIASMVGCRPEYVSRIGARMRKPPSRYSQLYAMVATLRHEQEKLRAQFEQLTRMHVQAAEKI